MSQVLHDIIMMQTQFFLVPKAMIFFVYTMPYVCHNDYEYDTKH